MVEDDALQRERMLGWLEGPQWIVREAANGREALDRLRQDKPDVILLDLMMPEMDGFAVVAALQKEPRGGIFRSSSSPRAISTRRTASD